MPIARLTDRTVGATISDANDDAEFDQIINELNSHTAAASPHTGHVIDTGDTMTGTLTLTLSTNSSSLSTTSTATTANVISATGNSLTSGSVLSVSSSSTSAAARNLVSITNTGAGSTSAVNLFLNQDINSIALSIDSEATSVPVIDIIAPVTTSGNVIDVGDADSLTTGRILNLASNSADVGSRNLVNILNDNAAASGAICLNLDQDANASALLITSDATSAQTISVTGLATTADVVDIVASSLVSGHALRVYSNSSDATSRGLVAFSNDHVGSTGTVVLQLQQDGTQPAISCDMSADGIMVDLNSTNAGLTNSIIRVDANRAANPAYSFFSGLSGDLADTEIILRGDGTVLGDAAAYVTPADYAEMFECEDPKGIEPGFFVSFVDGFCGLIKKACIEDDVLGIVSANPMILGDSAWGRWSKKYLLDEFNAYLKNPDGSRVLNPDYDPNSNYVSRQDRPEWVAIGMLGKLNVRTCEDITRFYVDVADGGSAKNGSKYRVIEIIRQKSNDPEGKGYGVVRVVFK